MRSAGFVLIAVAGTALAGCGGAAPPAAPAPAPQPIASSDQDRLQGVWAIESIDVGDPNVKGPAVLLNRHYQFRGNRIDNDFSGPLRVYAAFDLNDKVEPKTMTVTFLDELGKPYPTQGKFRSPPREWLYKFDGDTLVLAKSESTVFAEKPPQRPADFMAKLPGADGTGGVTVLRFKKTTRPVTEPAPPPPPSAPEKK